MAKQTDPDTDIVSVTPTKRGKLRKVPPQRTALPAPVTGFHAYVNVQGRGLIALPAALRQRYRLDEPGAQVEMTERSDGVIELRPTVAVPASQAWFWTDEWQEGERAVDAAYAAGEGRTFDDVGDFVAFLNERDGE